MNREFLEVPGKRPTFDTASTSDEEIHLSARQHPPGTSTPPENDVEGHEGASFPIEEPDDNREEWDNKAQFYMGVISYAVGLGNVWRFPYLCQKNGGGAFLIPYIIMMALGGLPLFLIELGIGQRLRTGPIGVWNAIHPYLGGVGVSAAIVSYLVALYYNVIITWCLYYLGQSFRLELPWAKCPTSANGTMDRECEMSSSPTMYFWNRDALDTSESIGNLEGFNPRITISLICAWTLIYLCVMKGIKSSGKVMYATATFPYVVTTIFLIRSITLEGAWEGLGYMIHPDLHMLYNPNVWLEAATQIFYSMGLGFGGLIAFGSYNPLKNNCKRDAFWLALCNILTSLYTAVVIFCVLGYMAHSNMRNCVEKDMTIMAATYRDVFASAADVERHFGYEGYIELMENEFKGNYSDMAMNSQFCNYHKIITEAAEGTGLAFVVFTEAILKFPFPPVWSILFFLMLLSLGLGSMFGTLEGVITSLNDSRLITVKKPILTAVLCGSACAIGLLFSTKAGQYWVALFDHFAGSYALMCVAFCEVIAVVYVYGFRRFSRDIEYMTGSYPSNYYLYTWRFITPTIMLVLFTTSFIQCFSRLPTYFAYDKATAKQVEAEYPVWALFIAFGMVVAAIAPVPLVWFLRKFKIWKADDVPAAQKCLGATASTTYMLKSEPSFNRMTESSVSMNEIERTHR
ncbi:unnamed protein product, partial [Mesorhabditis spiculigera]